MNEAQGYQPPMGTCDWGYCDEPATEWRWSENDLVHLPVCEAHELETELRALRESHDALADRLHRIAQSDSAWESGVVAEVLNEMGYEWGERGADRKPTTPLLETVRDWDWLASLVIDWIRANNESMLAYIEHGKPSKEILQKRMDTAQELRSVYESAPWVRAAAERYKRAPWNERAALAKAEALGAVGAQG